LPAATGTGTDHHQRLPLIIPHRPSSASASPLAVPFFKEMRSFSHKIS
jgi:hypothetical protein